MTRTSESIATIAAALAQAQGVMGGAAKSATNPHFKSKYADLSSIRDACQEELSKVGIAVIQSPSAEGPIVTVTTLLAHKSGEWMESELSMTAQQNTPQGIGSCITYARRYGLASMVGITPEDDDCNAASQSPVNRPQVVNAPKPRAAEPEGFVAWLAVLESVAGEGTEALRKAWKDSPEALCDYLMDTDSAKVDALRSKARAATGRVELPKAKVGA